MPCRSPSKKKTAFEVASKVALGTAGGRRFRQSSRAQARKAARREPVR
jgi:hypothetical protein